MIDKNKWLIVGLITSCHGISGQVKVKSLSDFEERFLKPGKRWLQKQDEFPTKIQFISGYKQPGKENFIIRFQGISTRNDAEKLKKYKILVKSNEIPDVVSKIKENYKSNFGISLKAIIAKPGSGIKVVKN